MKLFPMKNLILGAALAGLVASCGGHANNEALAAIQLSGSVEIDGSSTVFPISEGVAEEYRKVQPDIRVKIGVSGTGGGFKKFIAGEIDIADASRFIKDKELKSCAEVGREFVELPVAYDGLAVVVNTGNDFVTSITVDELNRMWNADATTMKWSDIRQGWPEREFLLFAPGQDSGTFDYFTETINGKSGNCRHDVTFSEDDNVLVNGVSGTPDGIGFFGLAYYEENADKLNLVAIDGGNGKPVLPTMATVESGEYAPLSRPLFIYVSTEAAKRAEVDDFIHFYLDNAAELSTDAGYVPLPAKVYAGIKQRYADRVTGSKAGMEGSLESLYL